MDDRDKPQTSLARVEANRANAQRSTGPKTMDGKARSSRNAITHGGYAEARHIEHGPLAEDAAEVGAFLDAIVSELAPRDALEAAFAVKISRICLRERRVGRLEDNLLRATAAPRLRQPLSVSSAAFDDQARLLGCFLEWVASTHRREATSGAATDGETNTSDADSDARASAKQLAIFINGYGRNIADAGRWHGPGGAPTSEADWEERLRSLVEEKFGSFEHAHAMATEYLRSRATAAAAARVEEGHQAAAASMETLDRVVRMTARISRELERALMAYTVLQRRQLDTTER